MTTSDDGKIKRCDSHHTSIVDDIETISVIRPDDDFTQEAPDDFLDQSLEEMKSNLTGGTISSKHMKQVEVHAGKFEQPGIELAKNVSVSQIRGHQAEQKVVPEKETSLARPGVNSWFVRFGQKLPKRVLMYLLISFVLFVMGV